MSSESRDINPPEPDKHCVLKCEICNQYIYVFDLNSFYQYDNVCDECMDKLIEQNKL